MIRCPYCGNVTDENREFCNACGSLLKQQNQGQQVDTDYSDNIDSRNQYSNNIDNRNTYSNIDNTNNISNSNISNNIDNKKSGNKTLIGLLIAAIAVVAVLVVVIALIIIIPIVRCNAFVKEGDTYYSEQNYEAAAQSYEEALNIKPTKQEAIDGQKKTYLKWGESLSDSEEYEEAMAVLDEGYEKTGDEEMLTEKAEVIKKYVDSELAKGNDNLDSMKYEDAEALYNKVIELDPENEDAEIGLIEILIRESDFEGAYEKTKRAYEKFGTDRFKEYIDMFESGNIFASNGWDMKLTYYDENNAVVYSHEFEYNLQGKKSKVTWYGSNGEYLDSLELTYDDRLLSLVTYTYTTRTGKINKVSTTYENLNYVETHYEGTSDEVDYYEKGIMNEDYKVLEWTYYYNDWTFYYKRTYEYNDKGEYIKIVDTYEDGSIREYYELEYDDNGNWIKYVDFNSSGQMTGYRIREYDSNNRLMKETTYNANGEVVSTVKYE